ncbi:MAG TPA: chemotaxis protein CheW, partial [Caulobacteraceae bacterium]
MAEPAEAASLGAAQQFLTFQLGQRLYALPASDVAEVIRIPTFARVPQAPAALLGLANLRGEVVPVASLRGLMGETGGVAADGRAIVVNHGGALALAVDRVEALVTRTEGASEAFATEGGELLTGAFETDKGVAKVLDLASLLASAFVARPAGRRATEAVAKHRAIETEAALESGRRLVSF